MFATLFFFRSLYSHTFSLCLLYEYYYICFELYGCWAALWMTQCEQKVEYNVNFVWNDKKNAIYFIVLLLSLHISATFFIFFYLHNGRKQFNWLTFSRKMTTICFSNAAICFQANGPLTTCQEFRKYGICYGLKPSDYGDWKTTVKLKVILFTARVVWELCREFCWQKPGSIMLEWMFFFWIEKVRNCGSDSAQCVYKQIAVNWYELDWFA